MEASILKVVLTSLFLIGCSWGQLLNNNVVVLRAYKGNETANKIPYIVAILENGLPICGGTIINEEWVITAAHCVANRSKLGVNAGTEKSLQVSQVFIHPSYDSSQKSINDDVALLHLSEKFVFNENVAAIDIIDQSELKEVLAKGDPGIISGWGADEMSIPSNSLVSKSIKLLPDEECSKRNFSPECNQYQSGAHLCSQFDKETKGAGRMGDGGPLVVNNKLAGIILYGTDLRNPACPELSSIYANVPYYKEFIKSNIP